MGFWDIVDKGMNVATLGAYGPAKRTFLGEHDDKVGEERPALDTSAMAMPGSTRYLDPSQQSELDQLKAFAGTKIVDGTEYVSPMITGQTDSDEHVEARRKIAEIEASGVNPWQTPVGGPEWAQAEAARIRGSRAEEDAKAAEQATQLRQQRLEGLDPLRRVAMGVDSVAAMQGDIEREQIQRATASEIASTRGGYDPAMARGAIMAGSQARADLGAKTAVARAQEQINAAQAYGTQLGSLERDDLGRTTGMAGVTTNRDLSALQALGVGLDEQGQRYGAMQDLEKLRIEREDKIRRDEIEAWKARIGAATTQQEQDLALLQSYAQIGATAAGKG